MADDAYVAAYLRELLETSESPFYHHSGWLESDLSNAFSFLESVYDGDRADLPDELEETRFATHVRKKNAAVRMGEALGQSPGSSLNFAAGMTEKAETETYRWWLEALSNDGQPCNMLLAGMMNAGKTNFAAKGIEVWLDVHPNGVVASNMVSLEVADYNVQSMSHFEELFLGDDEFIETNGESGVSPEVPVEKNILWLFDEVSKWCDARQFRTQVAKKYVPAIKKFAKRRIDAIHIAHSGKDVHPEMRSDKIMSDFVHKTGRKTALAYDSMDRETGEFRDKYTELNSIPPTTLEYSPDDFAPWNWK